MNIADEMTGVDIPGACKQCGLPISSTRLVQGYRQDYCCYGCYLLHSLTGSKGAEARPTLFLARLGFAAFLAMNAQTFTWALYGEDLPFLFPVEPESRQTINYLVFVLSLPVYLLIGVPFLKNALREFRNYSPGVDSLIAIGTTAAFVYSTYSTFKGSLSIYYDTAVMVLVLVTFGRYLEATARLKATEAIGKLVSAVPATARVARDGTDYEVPAREVPVGAHVRILPGEQVPVDGVVVEGESSVDESLLTGESRPIPKKAGDRVLGGSVNHDGFLRVETTSVAEEMYMSQLHSLVDQILRSRSPSQEFGDRLARYFTPSVIILAIGTAMFWWPQIGLSSALLTGLSVLLIACPCGLGIGATLAESIGYSRAAHQGIIAKSFSLLERVGNIQSIFIDKTGTLTEGRPRFEGLILDPAGKRTEAEMLSLVASLESKSEHPSALAVTSHARNSKIPLLPVSEFRNMPGIGVTGLVEDPCGRSVRVRIIKAAAEHQVSDFYEKVVTSEGSASYIYIDEVLSGVFLVADSIRPSAKEAVRRLRELELDVAVLSGDHPAVTAQIAQEAGIGRSFGGLTPEQKVRSIAEAQRERPGVCMVGDGINDAAALAAANIGMTLGSGTSFAKSSSDITILDSDLGKIPWIIEYGRRIQRTIRWNFLWVFLYNTIGIGLAVAGQIRPVYAALAMVTSSVFIIANSSRLKGHRVGR
jgi:P-type Cu+ transporter